MYPKETVRRSSASKTDNPRQGAGDTFHTSRASAPAPFWLEVAMKVDPGILAAILLPEDTAGDLHIAITTPVARVAHNTQILLWFRYAACR